MAGYWKDSRRPGPRNPDAHFIAFVEDAVRQGDQLKTGRDLVELSRKHGVDLFHDWTQPERNAIREKGKIPDLSKWQGVPIDDLMSTSALETFTTDQMAVDNRIAELIKQSMTVLETNPLREGLIEHMAEPCAIVIFGASGSLTQRKLMPALFSLACYGLLPPGLAIIGVALNKYSEDEFRELMRQSVEKAGLLGEGSCAWGELFPRPALSPGGLR